MTRRTLRAYRNAKKNNDKQNAKIEHDRARERVMADLLKDDTELFKQFSDNESFRRWLADTVFTETYAERDAPPKSGPRTDDPLSKTSGDLPDSTYASSL